MNIFEKSFGEWIVLKKVLLSVILTLAMATSQLVNAEDDAPVDSYAYFGFEPDITTNYLSEGNKLGFIRITLELMVKSPDHVAIIEHHAPLLRAKVVEILGEQTEEKIKSPAGKKEIREICLDAINALLKEETGQELAVSLLFTKYIYN
ncbi:MAG: flagellar basal body-associated protein FliL [Gammaproteobacteria bacterium MedPE]|nr:MAG: flagellar basal body-associated protein FliL [Gammaproteobacteria bacterium MedPE]